jgi:glucosamine--fructose-6-phosphate aminotransferase (isomerizing)
MCGIIGYIGPQNAVEVIMDGLARLEYRGYDSAGLALVTAPGELAVRRVQGKLAGLRRLLAEQPLSGRLGMGHTRWATHGRPSETNAHPHQAGDAVVVHNGIIENYLELKEELAAAGCAFSSETDTEIVAHLVERELAAGRELPEAARAALGRIRGSYALVMLDRRRPDLLVGARKDSPLILGLGGNGERFLASDVPAFLAHTNRVVFLQDGDVVVVEGGGHRITDLAGAPQQRPVDAISWSPAMAEKAGYTHFMQKEIFEQPRALIDTLTGRVKSGGAEVTLPELALDQAELKAVRRLVLLACGTSWHAALVGKFWLEGLARVPTEVDLGSEFRYRDPLVGPGDLVVAISQSGETADTLAAVKAATAKGAGAVAICNVVGSSLTRECPQGVIYTHAGPEIGVASTKAFTTQLIALHMLAVRLGLARGALGRRRAARLVEELVAAPALVGEALESEPQVKAVAEEFVHARDFLYLGRGPCYPIALEGALKLKEISYIHAEGYPAGEMKHGPIALIDENMPVVVLANHGEVMEKMLSNMQEVRARAGRIIAVTEADNQAARSLADAAITVPPGPPTIAPILLTVPLQLLAYHVAVLRGTDVDQPRNLAKSVTVE